MLAQLAAAQLTRHHTVIRKTNGRSWHVMQVLLDPAGDNLWHLGLVK